MALAYSKLMHLAQTDPVLMLTIPIVLTFVAYGATLAAVNLFKRIVKKR